METLKIIKIGGNIIDDETALKSFLEDFAKLEGLKILVHGGGKLATHLAEQMQVPVKMIDGRRITNKDTLEIITMVYAGKINKTIVAQLQAHNLNALGFSGADANTIVSNKRPIKDIDYGLVGDIYEVNIQIVKLLLNNDVVPVFCPITHNGQGQLLNTNADTIASALAVGFADIFKTELYYCFEKNGVLKNVEDDNSVIKTIDSKQFSELQDSGIISKGMLPKLKNCFHAINNKVSKVCIGSKDMIFNENIAYTSIEL